MNFLEPKYPCNNRISVADTSHWRRMRDFEPDWIQEKLLLFLPEDLVLFNCVYTNDGNANPIFISSILSTWSLCTGFNAKVTDDVGGGIEKFISVTNICRQNQRWHEHRSAIIILLETQLSANIWNIWKSHHVSHYFVLDHMLLCFISERKWIMHLGYNHQVKLRYQFNGIIQAVFVIKDFKEPDGFCLNHGLEHDENDYYFSLICKYNWYY